MKTKLLTIAICIALLALSSCSTAKVSNEKSNIKESEVSNEVLETTNLENSDRSESETEPPPSSNSVDNTTENTVKPIGGSDMCSTHNWGYHTYPMEIKEYIGEEIFREWSNTAHIESDENGCWPNANILILVEKFNVPNEVIIEAYKNNFYSRDWDIEALLNRDADALEAYAINAAETNYSNKLSAELNLKSMLFHIMQYKTDEKTIEYFNTVTNKGTYYPFAEITLYEMISNTSLTKDDFMAALGNATSNNREDFVTPHFEYNLDLLFGDQSAMEEAIKNLEIPEYESRVKMIDALLHVEE